jgi:hypothetical protein
MAKSKFRRVRDGGDQPPTAAEMRRVQASLRKTRGAYLARPLPAEVSRLAAIRPENIFLGPNPADTLKRCSRVIKLLTLPVNSALMMATDVQEARVDLFCGVLDALKHAETVLRDVGSEPDPRETRRP